MEAVAPGSRLGPLLRPPPLPHPRRCLGRTDPPPQGPRAVGIDVRAGAARERLRGNHFQLWGDQAVTNRFSHPDADSPGERLLTGATRSWARFWFAPRDPLGLHAVRVLAGLLFLSWLLVLAGHQEALFGLREGSPAPITWSVLYLCGTNATLLTTAYWVSVGVLVLFTIGVWPRLTSV